jgi:hypothetical protein
MEWRNEFELTGKSLDGRLEGKRNTVKTTAVAWMRDMTGISRYHSSSGVIFGRHGEWKINFQI